VTWGDVAGGRVRVERRYRDEVKANAAAVKTDARRGDLAGAEASKPFDV
jgi:hypothetical protein